MQEINTSKNPWTPKDEGDHYPTMKEWWDVETLFKTLDDKKKWALKGSMAYELETPSCFIINLLFDIGSNKIIIHKAKNDDIKKFIHKKNIVDLKYENFTIKGLHPNYHFHLEDNDTDVTADFKLKAKINPHWSAQDATNGYLPIGLDHYRYGWQLNCDLTGSIKLDNKIKEIKGKGYIEHAYGNWSYSNPFKRFSGVKKTISTYFNLFHWWSSQNKLKIPNRIVFTSENNLFGYDWFWGVFENDWSIFFGNSLFWISQGPAFGVLTLFTKGNNYIDFGKVSFNYNKTIYLKKYDIYHPVDITINAEKDDKKLMIRVWSVCDPFEYIDEFKGNGFYRAFIMPEMPGRMKGIYKDNKKTIELEGDCKIEQQRQPSKFGHNSLAIDFIKPPKGVGLNINFDSHYLKKEIITKIQLAPYPKFSFKNNKIKLNKL